MIKFVVAALWIAAATLGSVYYSFNSARSHTEEKPPEPSLLGGLDYVSMGIVTIPLMKDSLVYGYFIAKMVYTVEPAKKAKLVLPVETLLMDEIYTYLYANPQIDFAAKAELDLNNFRNGIRDAVNERVGDTMVHEVLIEQMDFLTKADIRDNTARRRQVSAAMEAAQAADKEKKKPEGGGGH
ncbi:MAG: hypothetical protein KF849_17585 [Rhizobiaceae bacterium]|nr:hypothetical protein [Rhizobiaceae bacterium]